MIRARKEQKYECALITGATRGIGLAFARELARSGCRLVIVARGEQRLAEVAAELLAQGAVEVVPLVCDLSKEGAAAWLHEECCKRGLRVDLVVNNAGLFAYCDQTAMDNERVRTMLQLNVVAPTELSRLFVGDMVGRGRGAIVNISSYAALMAWPGLAMYSGTKAYLDTYTCALAREVRGHGVRVLSVMPAGVATDLYGLPPRLQRVGLRLGVLWSAERVARGCLRALGGSRVRYVPGVLNRVLRPVVRHLPERVISFLRRKTLVFQK